MWRQKNLGSHPDSATSQLRAPWPGCLTSSRLHVLICKRAIQVASTYVTVWWGNNTTHCPACLAQHTEVPAHSRCSMNIHNSCSQNYQSHRQHHQSASSPMSHWERVTHPYPNNSPSRGHYYLCTCQGRKPRPIPKALEGLGFPQVGAV